MKEIVRLVGVLTAISLVAGVLLAFTNAVTRERIAVNRGAETQAALREVLPEFDNHPAQNTNVVVAAGTEWVFYVARRAGRYAGAAFQAHSAHGYGGTIRLMIGVGAGGKLGQIRILEQQETPGLGARILQEPFQRQFRDRDLARTNWRVRQDGGDLDAITGATISSRAVAEAVRTGLAVYAEHAAEIERTGE